MNDQITRDKMNLINHIEKSLNSSKMLADPSISLFEHGESLSDIFLRTEVTWPELLVINEMLSIQDVIDECNIPTTFYRDFVRDYLRLKVSKDRKSRAEFVDINKKDRFDDHATKFSNLSNIMGSKN